MNNIPELSVVVLCYRAGSYVREFVTQLETELNTEGIDYEMVLVANFQPGEPDDTPEIVKSLALHKPRCTVVSRAKEGMMGWDMRSGLRACAGKHLAVIDGDGQMPSSDIVVTYRILKLGRYDLVKTFRTVRHDGSYRRLISWVYNLLFRLLFQIREPALDINAKPKVMTRAAYTQMRLASNGWFTDAEVMIEALRLRLKVCHVSTVFGRNERRHTFITPATIFEFLYYLFYYRFAKR